MQKQPNLELNQDGWYIFEPFRLDTAEAALYRDGELIPLTPKVFSTLLVLVSESGKTLTKDDLIKRVWPDAAVGDGSLAQNILVLRKILDPFFPPEGPIVTVPRRGYRFTAPVRFEAPTQAPTQLEPLPSATPPPAPPQHDDPQHLTIIRRPISRVLLAGALIIAAGLTAYLIRSRTNSSPPGSRRSVAILAFKNLTAKPEYEWYSTALAETITGELRAGSDLRIISSDNVHRMQQELSLPGAIITRSQINDVRNELGCDLILSGSYLTIGSKIRIELVLSDARSSGAIASVTDTDEQNRLLELVSRTGQQLRSKLGVHAISRTESESLQHSISANDRANRFYFDGLAALKLRDAPQAEKQLSLAVETDPAFALAHSALSATWHDLGYSARALKEAKTALDLADSSQSREDRLAGEAQYYECLFDWKRASQTYRSLWQFFPDNIEYALQLVQVEYSAGHPAEALKILEELHNLRAPDGLDPRIDLFESIGQQLSGNYQRSYDAATSAAQKAEKAKARILLAQARVKQGLSAERLGRGTEARNHYAEARTLFESVNDKRDVADALTLDAESLRAAGQTEAAIAEVEKALALSRDIGFTRLTNRILASYSNMLLNTGSLKKAQDACDEALAANSEINDVGTAFTVRMDRGGIAKAQGRYNDARTELLESVRIAKDTGYRLETANATTVLGNLDADLGRLSDARRELEEGIARKRELGNPGSLAQSLALLAVVLRDQDDLAGSMRLTNEQCSILESLRRPVGVRLCRLMRARLLMDGGKVEEAKTELATVLSDASLDRVGAKDLATLSILQFDSGDLAGARKSIAAAQRKLQRSTNNPDLSLPVTLAAAQIAQSIPQLQQIARQAQNLGLSPIEMQARLSIALLDSKRTQPPDTTLASDAEAKGFARIARMARDMDRNRLAAIGVDRR